MGITKYNSSPSYPCWFHLGIAIEAAQQMDHLPQRDAGAAGAAETGGEGRQPRVVLTKRGGSKLRMVCWLVVEPPL